MESLRDPAGAMGKKIRRIRVLFRTGIVLWIGMSGLIENRAGPIMGRPFY